MLKSIQKCAFLCTVLLFTLFLNGCTCEHEYSDWIVVKDATCVEVGVKRHTCAKCGETEEYEIAKKDTHTYDDWVITKEATCREFGTRTKTCISCGDTQQESIAKKQSHTYGEWETTKAATCSESGIQTKTCTVCAATQQRSIQKKEHTYGSWKTTKAATCNQPGTQTRTCSVCGKAETQTIEASHSWSSGLVGTCTLCGSINGNDVANLVISDFRDLVREHSATGQCAYALSYSVTTTTDVSSKTEMFVLVVIRYKIVTNWEFVKLYNITDGTSIEDPVEYYEKKADQFYGATRLNYLEQASAIAKQCADALEYMVQSLESGSRSGPGVYLSADDLNEYR